MSIRCLRQKFFYEDLDVLEPCAFIGEQPDLHREGVQNGVAVVVRLQRTPVLEEQMLHCGVVADEVTVDWHHAESQTELRNARHWLPKAEPTVVVDVVANWGG